MEALPRDPLVLWEQMKLPEDEQLQQQGSGKSFHSHAAPLGLKRSVRRIEDYDGNSHRFEVDTFSGERHGRRVKVMPRFPRREGLFRWAVSFALNAETRVFGSFPRFEARSSGGRLRSDDADPLVRSALDSANEARRWSRTHVHSGDGEIRVARRLGMLGASGFHDWVYDLWLAEHLADRLGRT
jgi:hypothetical protein